MAIRRILTLSLVLLIAAFCFAVQRDTFLRRWLVASPAASPHSAGEPPALLVRCYDIDDLLPPSGPRARPAVTPGSPGGSAGSSDPVDQRELAAEDVEDLVRSWIFPSYSDWFSTSRRRRHTVVSKDRTLIVLGDSADQARVAELLRQIRDLKPGEHGPLVSAVPVACIARYKNFNTHFQLANDDDAPLAALDQIVRRNNEPEFRSSALRSLSQQAGVRIDLLAVESDLQGEPRVEAACPETTSLRVAIQELCQSDDLPPLAFDVVDGVIVITPQLQALRHTFTRIYDVRDIAPHMVLPTDVGGTEAFPRSPDEHLAEFLNRQDTFTEESWRRYGEFQVFRGRLIVTQTREQHRRVAAYLSSFRRKCAGVAE